jgi:hypothetical protein
MLLNLRVGVDLLLNLRVGVDFQEVERFHQGLSIPSIDYLQRFQNISYKSYTKLHNLISAHVVRHHRAQLSTENER